MFRGKYRKKAEIIKQVSLGFDLLAAVELLGTAESGRLLTAIAKYALREEETQLAGREQIIWAQIKFRMDEEKAEHAAMCERNRRNGSAPKKATEATEATRSAKEKENEKETEKEEKSPQERKEAKERITPKREEKEKEKEKERANEEAALAGLAPDVQAAMQALRENCKAIRQPMTSRAFCLSCSKLKKLYTDPEKQLACINEAIENRWKTVWPLTKSGEKMATKQTQHQGPLQEELDEINEFLREMQNG